MTEKNQLGVWVHRAREKGMLTDPGMYYYTRCSDGLILGSIREDFPYVARYGTFATEILRDSIGSYTSLEQAQRAIEQQYERDHSYSNKTSFRPDTDDSPFVLKFAFFAGLAGICGVITYFALTLFR